MVLIKTRQFLLLVAIVLSIGLEVYSQPPSKNDKNAFRSEVIRTVMQRAIKNHYNSPSLDDAYSATLWKNVILKLDPNKTTFLESDITRLAKYKQELDDQLKEGSTLFFDSVYATYLLRMNENQEIAEKILSQPVNLTGKDEFRFRDAADFSFPVNRADKENVWKNYLRYSVLKKYVELRTIQDSLLQKGIVDKETESKARNAVIKALSEQNRKLSKAGAEDDYFAFYLNNALNVFDPHSAYRGPIDNSLKDRLSGQYYGLGIELEEREAGFFVKRLLPGGAAQKSNLVQENDRILEISDNSGKMTPVIGLTSNEVAAMIRGEKDSNVRLKLQQNESQPREVSLVRGEIATTANKAKPAIIDEDGKKYGYIFLPVFYMDTKGGLNGSAADVGLHLRKLMEEGVNGVIIDLRGNGGGSLDEVVLLASHFLPPNTITQLRSKNDVKEHIGKLPNAVYNGPLVVMVDEASASASEIFSAVIQDSKRGIIVGSNTYGKGTAQINTNVGKMGDSAKNIPDINYGSITLTTQKFYRISGVSTQLRGVQPDVVFQSKMRLNILTEKDYSNTLNNDTIQKATHLHYVPFMGIDRTIENANKRLAANPTFKKIEESLIQLQLQSKKPVPVDIKRYVEYYLQISELEKKIESLKKLKPSDTLSVDFPNIKSIAPDLRSEIPGYDPRFMKQLSEDIYLKESIQILKDLNTSKNN